MSKTYHSVQLMGRKRGMTQIFDEQGNVVVCTVIEVEPNVVTQVKTKAVDGYNAIQLGAGSVKEQRLTKPLRGHFEKQGVSCCRTLQESRFDSVDEYTLGQEIGLGALSDVKYIDVKAKSKGKGFQGVMKLHGFAGGPAAHGSGFHRSAGSTGMRSTPGRCLPGGKRASHMGARRTTVQNLEVVRVDEEKNLLLVKGAIPGSKGDLVTVSRSVKKHGVKA